MPLEFVVVQQQIPERLPIGGRMPESIAVGARPRNSKIESIAARCAGEAKDLWGETCRKASHHIF
jgi:hypothetical protein